MSDRFSIEYSAGWGRYIFDNDFVDLEDAKSEALNIFSSMVESHACDNMLSMISVKIHDNLQGKIICVYEYCEWDHDL